MTKLLLLDSLLQEKSRIKELIMSDVEGDDVPSAAPVASGPMDINTAIQEVLKQALIGDGLARGLREAAKALDKRQALPCILAENCDEPMYKKVVKCSAAVVRDWGSQGAANDVLQDYLKANK